MIFIATVFLAVVTNIVGVFDNLDYGNPGGNVRVLDSPGFAIGYSEEYGQPLWVSYRLTAFEATNNVASRANFIKDCRLGKSAHAPNEYTNTGFDRGHIAPAADMSWSTNAMEDSFMMSNMSPQCPSFNRGIWKELEAWVRDRAVKEDGLFVYSGPIFGDSTTNIGKGIYVPEGYYKIIYSEKRNKMIGFMLKNESSTNSLKSFACSVNDIESATNLDFFKRLSWWNEIWFEQQNNPQDWDL